MAGFSRGQLDALQLARGGIEITQTAPFDSVFSGLPPEDIRDPDEFGSVLDVGNRAMGVLMSPEPEAATRVRFVTDLAPQLDTNTLSCTPVSALFTVVRQAGEKHPHVLHVRAWDGNWFGPSSAGESLPGRSITRVTTKLQENLTAFLQYQINASPSVKLAELEEKIARLERLAKEDKGKTIISIGGLSLVRVRRSV